MRGSFTQKGITERSRAKPVALEKGKGWLQGSPHGERERKVWRIDNNRSTTASCVQQERWGKGGIEDEMKCAKERSK